MEEPIVLIDQSAVDGIWVGDMDIYFEAPIDCVPGIKKASVMIPGNVIKAFIAKLQAQPIDQIEAAYKRENPS